MVTSESNQSVIHTPQLRVFEDPYVKVRIDSPAHEHFYYKDIVNWSKSTTTQTAKWDNRSIVGSYLPKYPSSIDFTSTINLPHTGLYGVMISYLARAKYNGSFTLYDGSTQIGDSQPLYSKYDQLSYKVYSPQHFTSGNHTFKISLSKSGFVRDIIIYPIDRWEGDNQGKTTSHTDRLDFREVEFTQNSVAEVNTCTLSLPVKEEYFRRSGSWYSPYVFDWDDVVTVWLGETRKDTTAMFGGYITGISYNDGELELTCRDRLLDLDRVPLYKNFTLGGAKAPTGSTRPFTSFPNVYELIRYLSEYSRYPLDAYLVPYDFAVNLNFDTIDEYNETNVAVWNKTFDLKQGHPAPSLKLTLGSSTGTGYCYLYDENSSPYDAADYEYLSFDYYTSGCGAKTPLPWNLIINMTDDTDVAKDYTVQVNDGSGSNPLTTYTPVLNGRWQRMTLNLKDLFDKKVESEEYNINQIYLKGSVTSAMLTQNSCSSLWVGGLYCYNKIQHNPKYASQDVKTPLEEIQQVCDRTNHAAYVVFGDSRDQDVLVVNPCKYTTASIGIDESDNLLSLEGVDYTPVDDEFTNYRHMTFNFKNNKAGSGYAWDLGSMAHYREYQRHDFNNDVQTQVDANTDINNYLTNHKWPELGFTVKIRGTGQLMPEQYCSVSIPSHRIIGNYPVKSITHTWGQDKGYTTKVDFGKASNRFRKLIKSQEATLRNLSQKNQSSDYQIGVSDALGVGSPGAYSI